MKVIRKLIYDCNDCDFLRYRFTDSNTECMHPDFEQYLIIPDMSIIPDWCPLEDYEVK